MAGLTLSHLYKRYENSGKKKKTVNDFAVKDLNLECEQGEFVAFLGPSARQDHHSADDRRSGGHHRR